MSDDETDLAAYDALPEDDADDADGSPLRIDIADGEGPELVTGEEDSDSVAPRPGHDHPSRGRGPQS